MSNKKDFYIFLDYYGVFYFFAWEVYVKKNNLEEKGFSREFCPDNLKIFNKILNEIRKNGFNPKIVITSDERNEEMQNFIERFKKYGIDYDGEYDRTGVKQLYKMYDIATYAKEHNIGMNDNFIIIDDDALDMRRHYALHPCHFLETSGLGGEGLNNDDFLKFKEINLPQIIALSAEEEKTL